jgi:hypothetical protein
MLCLKTSFTQPEARQPFGGALARLVRLEAIEKQGQRRIVQRGQDRYQVEELEDEADHVPAYVCQHVRQPRIV